MSILRFPTHKIRTATSGKRFDDLVNKAVAEIVKHAQVDQNSDPSLVRLAKRLERISYQGK